MSNNPSLFTDLKLHNTTITTAGTVTPVTEIGTARLRAQLQNEITNFTLTNTLLVPSLPVNLISQSKLENKFYITTKNGYQVCFRDKNELFMETKIIERLYVVNQDREFNTFLLAKESLQIWYKKINHINVQRFKLMLDNTVEGIKFLDTKLTDFHYNVCIRSKAHHALIHNK